MLTIQLKTKLTLMFVVNSIIAALLVAGIAYWFLMKNFNQSIQAQAFENFSQDVQAYLDEFGSWEIATRAIPFHHFVRQQRAHLGGPKHGKPFDPPPFHGGLNAPPKEAPFKFLLTDKNGVVVKPQSPFEKGQVISKSLLREGFKIMHKNEIALLAIPIGTPNLSKQDKYYLNALQHALSLGALVTVIVSVILGWLFSRRLSGSLNELTKAISMIGENGELRQKVVVKSNDEIGKLTHAFNRMSDELTKTHSELHEASVRDALTGLHNRRYFSEHAEEIFQQAKSQQSPLCVILVDVDHFKRVNDEYSHQIGDRVLQTLSEILETNIRRGDILARFGGEEFAFVFPTTTITDAFQRCENLRLAVANNTKWKEIHPDLIVTISIGISSDVSLGTIERMLDSADQQLYKAKESGRNCVYPKLI